MLKRYCKGELPYCYPKLLVGFSRDPTSSRIYKVGRQQLQRATHTIKLTHWYLTLLYRRHVAY